MRRTPRAVPPDPCLASHRHSARGKTDRVGTFIKQPTNVSNRDIALDHVALDATRMPGCGMPLSMFRRASRESPEVVLLLEDEIDSPGFQPQGIETVMGGDEQAVAIGAVDRDPVDVCGSQKVGRGAPDCA